MEGCMTRYWIPEELHTDQRQKKYTVLLRIQVEQWTLSQKVRMLASGLVNGARTDQNWGQGIT